MEICRFVIVKIYINSKIKTVEGDDLKKKKTSHFHCSFWFWDPSLLQPSTKRVFPHLCPGSSYNFNSLNNLLSYLHLNDWWFTSKTPCRKTTGNFTDSIVFISFGFVHFLLVYCVLLSLELNSVLHQGPVVLAIFLYFPDSAWGY